MKHKTMTIAVVVAAIIGVQAAGAFTGTPAGSVRGVVAFVGDSNTVYGSARRDIAMTTSEVGYVPIDLGAQGAGVRWNGCRGIGPCPNPAATDYWAVRLPAARQRLDPDAWVVALGINDSGSPGTVTTRGYAGFGSKIDYIMWRLPLDKPVLWTNLPCSIEPAKYVTGCNIINGALEAAPSRWPNLTIVDWAATAQGHPEFMSGKPDDPHYSAAGYDAYSLLVVVALDVTFP